MSDKIICRACGREVKLRKDGRVPQHATPGQHPDDGLPKQMCSAGGGTQ